MSNLTVLAVVSEIFPLVKTGGLADVAGALPAALAAEDVEVVTLVPGYPAVMKAIERAETAIAPYESFGGHARVLRADAGGLDLFVLDAPHLFTRAGGPYTAPDGTDWPDNPFRFAALSQAGAALSLGDAPGFSPDVVHAHDWQAGLTAAYLEHDPRRRPGTVITIHNLAFQGQYPAELLGPLGLPARGFLDRRRRILRHDRLPQGRARLFRPHHHGLADLCRGDPHARLRHGPRRAAARPRHGCDGHPQRHRRSRLGSRPPTK